MHGSSRSCCDQGALPRWPPAFFHCSGVDLTFTKTRRTAAIIWRIRTESDALPKSAEAVPMLDRDKPSACRSRRTPAGAGTASGEGPEDACASPSSTARRDASPVSRRSSARNQIGPPGAAGRTCASEAGIMTMAVGSSCVTGRQIQLPWGGKFSIGQTQRWALP